jgi:hypothetical protein
MAIIELAKLRVRRGQENITGVPRLDSGEIGWAQDTEHLYIGKRIDEGAVNNDNSRILTDNDLNNIFTLLGAASTTTLVAVYNYRDGVLPDTKSRLLQSKLDDQVNLSDFGVTAGAIDSDITLQLKNAVKDLFGNMALDAVGKKDVRRKLSIPAGSYIVTESVELPPYTTLIGEGSELTTIKLVNTLTNVGATIFSTVDAKGIGSTIRLINPGNPTDLSTIGGLSAMSTGLDRARNVHIQGMTLEYSTLTTFSTTTSLISFDNVLDSSIVDCVFKTTTTGSTFGIGGAGIGIEIRGTGGGLGSGDVNLCENVQILNCKFDGLHQGVFSTGTVIHPVIQRNVFSNLYQGVVLGESDAATGPSNGLIDNNRFENIVKEAIYVADNPNNIRSNHLSSNNFFIQSGNGTGLSDYITTIENPVVVFNAPGNKSVNDYFHRRTVANDTPGSAFYYNPLIKGSTTIDDASTYNKEVLVGVNAPVATFGLTGTDQLITLQYQLTNAGLSRKGVLIINVAPDGYSNITDTYNYIEYPSIVDGAISFNMSMDYAESNNYVILNCNNESATIGVTLEYQINIVL